MRATTPAILISAMLLLGCDDGSWESAVSKYEDNILKIERLDEECQMVEGDEQGGKFYINIIDNSFVRSALVPLDYDPSHAYPPIDGSPLTRKTAMGPAWQIAEQMQRRDETAVKNGEKRAVMSLRAYQGSILQNSGVDGHSYCLSYVLYSTGNDGDELHCTYAYTPKDHVLVRQYPDLYDRDTNKLVPHDQPQVGYVAREAAGRWSSTWVKEKSVCRPTEVKLR